MTREALLELLMKAASEGKLPKYVFHGTDSRALEKIKKSGLASQLPGDYEPDPGVWVSPRQSTAADYARSTAESRRTGVESQRAWGGPANAEMGEAKLVRMRLKPLLPHMSERSLQTLLHRIQEREGHLASPPAWSKGLVGETYLPAELNTVRKGVPASSLKAASLKPRSNAVAGKFTKLSLAAILLGLLGDAAFRTMNTSKESESA